MFTPDDIILGTTLAGGATGAAGAFGQFNASKKVTADEIEQAELRRSQMELDSQRASRTLIRNAQMTRAIGESNQSQSGANWGSAAGGLRGQIQGQTGVESNSIFQNLQIGEKMINSQEKEARDKQAAAAGGGLASLGGSIIKAGGPLGSIFGGGAGAGMGAGALDPMSGALLFL